MLLTPEHTVEDALGSIEDRAAMLRFFADSITLVDGVPERAFFSGLADAIGEIQATAHAVRHALAVEALNTLIGSARQPKRDKGHAGHDGH